MELELTEVETSSNSGLRKPVLLLTQVTRWRELTAACLVKTTNCRFENLQLNKNACELRPILEQWFQDAETQQASDTSAQSLIHHALTYRLFLQPQPTTF